MAPQWDKNKPRLEVALKILLELRESYDEVNNYVNNGVSRGTAMIYQYRFELAAKGIDTSGMTQMQVREAWENTRASNCRNCQSRTDSDAYDPDDPEGVLLYLPFETAQNAQYYCEAIARRLRDESLSDGFDGSRTVTVHLRTPEELNYLHKVIDYYLWAPGGLSKPHLQKY